ncbi:MAG: M20 family metallo-hydrolase [Rikenellaceae bacterium]|nr:M20 family metallo-hydrolase [Rikenellaceae bacterium]
MADIEKLTEESIGLLKEMIRTESFSRQEDEVAGLIEKFLGESGLHTIRRGNNILVYNKNFDCRKRTILLNSHLDTVKPNPAYTRDPFAPDEADGKIYGLGSNDAGASVVSLIAVARYFYERNDLKYNICLALTAEEECSGNGGIESVLPEIPNVDSALVGEPTGMNMAIAEKGLLVIDCKSHGRAGHAARQEGESAIYQAMRDIAWFQTYKFPKNSDLLGDVLMTVTMINGGTQHNVVPAECDFTVDIRITECYTHKEVLDTIRKNVSCDVVPRSVRLRSSSILESHPFVLAGKELGLQTFGSPTMSDQALIPYPSVKIGPGESARSHSADEFIKREEIENGIKIYINLLDRILK